MVVEPTHLKNMLVKLDHPPKDRAENKRYLKPLPIGNLMTPANIPPIRHLVDEARVVSVTLDLKKGCPTAS